MSSVPNFMNTFSVKMTSKFSVHENLGEARRRAKEAIMLLDRLGIETTDVSITDRSGVKVPLEPEPIRSTVGLQEVEGELRSLKKMVESRGLNAEGLEDCFIFEDRNNQVKVAKVDWSAVKKVLIDSGQVSLMDLVSRSLWVNSWPHRRSREFL